MVVGELARVVKTHAHHRGLKTEITGDTFSASFSLDLAAKNS